MRSSFRIRVLVPFIIVFATLILANCAGGHVYNAPSPPCRLEMPPGFCIWP